ncbi:acyl carrier protein [Yinghuangia seranimata]|uniref:acyl carrier protein n=1 Tax=Yinghuangia seranimata TaxID=408067 RepID=UPI00248CED49|nr:beta-ketoacyl reductase [Yinghuangia seranimata]MDI2128518.1 beta-ketoacyl reductase [Yinghuangia seranimata]
MRRRIGGRRGRRRRRLGPAAHARLAEGRPAAVLTVGPWASADDAPHGFQDALRSLGLRALPPRSVADAVADALADGAAPGRGAPLVADVDAERLVGQGTAELLRLWAGVPEVRKVLDTAPGPDASLLDRLAEASDEEQVEIVQRLLCGHAAAVLGYTSAQALDPDTSFLDLGLSSFTALELSTRLTTAGIELPLAAVYDHPTPSSLARFLRAQLVGGR